MKESLIVEVGLKAAYEKVKGGIEISDLRMTPEETAQYWFAVGFKMGHKFAEFVAQQKESKAADEAAERGE